MAYETKQSALTSTSIVCEWKKRKNLSLTNGPSPERKGQHRNLLTSHEEGSSRYQQKSMNGESQTASVLDVEKRVTQLGIARRNQDRKWQIWPRKNT